MAFTPPEGGGRLPVIRPGPHATVFLNGEPVHDPRVVRASDRVEVRPVDDAPSAEPEVEITEAGLKAILSVRRKLGWRYAVADCEPAPELTVRAIPQEPISPPLLTHEQVLAALERAGVVYGVDEAALETCCTLQDVGPVVVATGDPPQLPVHARVELYFPNDPLVRREAWEDDRVDLLGLFQVPSVRPGELLAEKIPPQEGRPGRTVTGQEIPVPPARDLALHAGPGALVDESGLRVYAARGGRPCFSGGIVRVLPQYVVAGSVDANTGHVEFDGDVVVQGDVGESMRVAAAGKVTVSGGREPRQGRPGAPFLLRAAFRGGSGAPLRVPAG